MFAYGTFLEVAPLGQSIFVVLITHITSYSEILHSFKHPKGYKSSYCHKASETLSFGDAKNKTTGPKMELLMLSLTSPN